MIYAWQGEKIKLWLGELHRFLPDDRGCRLCAQAFSHRPNQGAGFPFLRNCGHARSGGITDRIPE